MEQPHILSFEQLPQAVSQLLSDVAELRTLISTDRDCPSTPTSNIEPIGVDEACRLLHKARSTVYNLCRKGILPCYKKGKKLHFFHGEILNYISEGRRKTIAEIQSEIGDGK